MFAEWDTIRVVDCIAIETPYVFITIGHAVTWPKCRVKI